MSSSYSYSETESFTVVHARKLASKVATDLKRFQRFYGAPTDYRIAQYERELVELLKRDAISEIIYGFKRQGRWTGAAVKYKALNGSLLNIDDDPGRVRPDLDIVGASFGSFRTTNGNYDNLPASERQAIADAAGFTRETGSTPALEGGYWAEDLTYAAGGRALGRSSVRIY